MKEVEKKSSAQIYIYTHIYICINRMKESALASIKAVEEKNALFCRERKGNPDSFKKKQRKELNEAHLVLREQGKKNQTSSQLQRLWAKKKNDRNPQFQSHSNKRPQINLPT